MPSVSVDSTDWLIARLPALAIARMRSPGLEKTWSLRKVETLSSPALVRVSAEITIQSLARPTPNACCPQVAIPGCQPKKADIPAAFWALVPTFRSSCYASALTFHELRKVIGTSKHMILVPLFYLKFLKRIRRSWYRNFK
jgi:hypothetical protein